MSRPNQLSSTAGSLVLTILTLCTSAGSSQAAYTVNISQVGSDVVAKGSGSFTTTGLTPTSSFTSIGIIDPVGGTFVLGYAKPTDALRYHVIGIQYIGYGPGLFSVSTLGSGDIAGLYAPYSDILVPVGYVSGAQLSSSCTIANSTFSSAGLTVGTYTYHYTTTIAGDFSDTITINIGASAVPEPSSLALCGFAGSLGLVVVRVRRKRTA